MNFPLLFAGSCVSNCVTIPCFRKKLIFFFPCCLHVLLCLHLLQEQYDFGFNNGNLPLRDIWTRTFLVPSWHCLSAFSSSRNVIQCPSSLIITVCVRLSCTPVNATHIVLQQLPRETQVDHLASHCYSAENEFLPAATAYPNQGHIFP